MQEGRTPPRKSPPITPSPPSREQKVGSCTILLAPVEGGSYMPTYEQTSLRPSGHYRAFVADTPRAGTLAGQAFLAGPRGKRPENGASCRATLRRPVH